MKSEEVWFWEIDGTRYRPRYCKVNLALLRSSTTFTTLGYDGTYAKENDVMLRIMMLLRNGVCLTANDVLLRKIADADTDNYGVAATPFDYRLRLSLSMTFDGAVLLKVFRSV